MTKGSLLSEIVGVDEVKEACKTSLYFLCTQMLGYKDWDKVHDELEVFLAKPASKKALLLPRGHLKSSIVTIGKSVQFILRNPNVRILIANQVWDMSRKFLSEIKAHLESANLSNLFGNFQSAYWNQDAVTVSQRTRAKKEPTILTTGIEAETTGGHFDVIFLDDLVGHQNCQTQEQREKAKRFRRSMINLLEPGGTLIEIGTRWHLDDTFAEIFEKEKDYYDIMIRTVIEEGKTIFPRKFNQRFDSAKKVWLQVRETCMDYIDHLKKSMTPAEFSAQYMNNPIDEENQLFKPEFFKYWNQRPPRLFVSMTLDPAISEKQAADYFAINVSGMDENYNIFVLDTLKGHWKVSDQVDNIFKMYQKWHPSVVGLETIAYQKALKGWLEEKMRERGVYFPITELKRNTNESKEFRIKALEPFFREGKVFLAPWMKSLEDELMTFPKGKHDDEVDALASQLDLLVPGDSESALDAPAGSWESEFQKAKQRNQYHDFFHETRNG
jgi:predicted phage terminase large subunit-like protein